jgi:hypothetical protein
MAPMFGNPVLNTAFVGLSRNKGEKQNVQFYYLLFSPMNKRNAFEMIFLMYGLSMFHREGKFSSNIH